MTGQPSQRYQDHLIAACERIFAEVTDSPDLADYRARESASSVPDAPIYRIQTIFRLTDYERECLLLVAARELLPNKLSAVTIGLALAALPQAEISAWVSEAPLRKFRLVEASPAGPYLSKALWMPESVLQYLLGIAVIDAELPVRRLGTPTGHLTWSGPLARTASTRKHAGSWLTQRNFSAYVVDSAQISDARDFDARWTRDSLLHAAALIVEGEPATVNAVLQAAQYPHVVVGAATPERPAIDEPKVDREAVWREALGAQAERMNGKLSHLARQFRLDEAEIRLAAASAEPWQAAREIARRDLDGLAMRIDSRATWNDLILPPATEAMLREVTAQTRHRHRVYEEWGMGSRSRRGLGIAALFHGPSGTGKTLTAEVIANELQVDLYHVDLSQIVSKYIGETEKNLEKIFTAAERAGALLLFDEADALFGKRSEIRDAHDRYANIEVGYLLQRIEAYDGLVILTTNLKGSLDSAFLRRFRFVVSFPFPDTEDRRRLWQIAFPNTAPVEEVDTHRLSRVVLSGGSIRNIALAAAFLAAEESGPINTDRILRAASRELAKMERSSSELAEVMT
jgi:hypothetical protein